MDSFIEPLVVVSGSRVEVQQEQIPDIFWPVTGKWGMRGMFVCLDSDTLLNDPHVDIHKVFFDDESYNSGHGHAYEQYQIDPVKGAMVIVRPDQCELGPILHFGTLLINQDISMVLPIEAHQALATFFAAFTLPQL